MNLLFVFPAYEPAWQLGGIVRCTSDLCRALVKLGHEVTVYTFNQNGSGQPVIDSQDDPACVVQGGVKTWFFRYRGQGLPTHSSHLTKRLSMTAPHFDLVYVAAIWQWLGAEVTRICARYKVPVVNGLHGALTEKHMVHGYAKKSLYWRLFVRRMLRRSTALHFTTVYEEQASKQWAGGVNSILIPNGVVLDRLVKPTQNKTQLREMLGIPQDTLVALTVGRLARVKRIDLMIQALAQVPSLHFVVAGSGPDDMTNEYHGLADACGVSERITWLGHVDGEQLSAAYFSADLFTLTSEDENFSMVTLEALSCGLPVLLSHYVGVWEALQNEQVGHAVDLDVDEIAEKLRDFVDAPQVWDAMGQRGIDVVKRFDIMAVAEDTAQKFEKLIHANT